jgi:hypothetical protein
LELHPDLELCYKPITGKSKLLSSIQKGHIIAPTNQGADMRPTEPNQIIERYIEAIARRDFETARSYLADRGFEYVSPIARFDDADSFASSMHAVGAILQRMETRLRFTAGSDICHVLDVTVAMASYKTQRVVHLAHVDQGRISRIEVIFDASDYHRMIGEQSPP